MSETPLATLDTADPEIRRQRFENAWRPWQLGQETPRWQEFLPAPGESCSPEVISLLLHIDIEFRAKAGLPALLVERYFEHPRLQNEDARLDDVQQVELIRWEYFQRLQHGQRPRRADYEAAFPRYSDSLRQLKPRSQCPSCHKILVLEDTFQTLHCPDCGCESSLLPTAPPFVAPTTETTATPSRLDLRGYELMETLGEGGMGEVYRCNDPALGRDLAIKVMKAELRGQPKVEHRFLREARVTGSLQHPGIVPVHNLGRLADGRLHYTMRLVRGRTFAAILKDEAGQRERLPYLLSIFEKICQAVAYAHSKRVIHRDLKPSNVMVGKFGEVQVMDWGLAKMLGQDDAATESEEKSEEAGTRIVTESDTPVDLSRMGLGFGTPAYMPVEQALGEWDAVDERADVFALGSILCDVLTGMPAYWGDREEVYRRAKRGDVSEAFARLQQCGADAALLALCRECLSPRREDRPRDAAVVAKRVAEYQAEVQERLRQAEVERAQAQLKAREARKQRRLLIALVLVLLTGASISVAMNERLASTKHELESANEQLTAKNQQLTQTQKQAEDNARETRTIVDKYYERASNNMLLNQPQFLPLRKSLLEPVAVYYRDLLPKLRGDSLLRQDLAKTCRMIGLITRSIGSYEEALPYMIEYCDLSAELARESPSEPSLKAEWARALAQRCHVLRMLKRNDEARPVFLQCIAIWEQLAKTDPAKYAHELAYEYDDMSSFLLDNDRDRNGAWRYLRKGLEIMEPLVEKAPDNEEYVRGIAYFYNNRGELYTEEKNLNAALQDHKRALQIREKLVKDYPQDTKYNHRYWLARSLTRAAEVELKLGERDQAAQYFGAARDRFIGLLDGAPANLYYREDLAKCCQQYGRLLLDRKQWRDAFAALKTAGDNWEKVADAGPRGMDARLDCARARAGEGKALAELDRRTEAIVEWQRAVEQLREAVKSGFKDVAGLKQDEDLKRLRERDDFKKLLAELEAENKK
jgi:serine/threonine protein kinase